MQVVTVEEGLQLLETPFTQNRYKIERESVSIRYSYGRVLGTTALAKMNYPPFRRSAMDCHSICRRYKDISYTRDYWRR